MITVLILRDYDDKWEMVRSVDPKSIAFLDGDVIAWRTYICAYIDNKVVGVTSLVEESSRWPNSIGVGFISTHIEYRNRGVAKAMVDVLFELAKQLGKCISNTAYEPLGEQYLEHVMQRTALAYPSVVLYESNY